MRPTLTTTINQLKTDFKIIFGLQENQKQLFFNNSNKFKNGRYRNPKKILTILFFLFFSLVGESVFAQTPGLIIRKGNVTGGAPTVTPLDPNGDGWVSATSSGFSGDDLGTNSEINYVAVPAPPNEPTGDLRRGSTGYFSEIVDDINGNGFYFNSDGTNLRFRMRVGGLVPGSKGYSALIDSDGKFGFSGPNADPNAVSSNPGFEYEVVYESNFQVSIYRVDGAATGTLLTSYNLDTFPNHAQIAVAATTDGGDPDYFYDWYVPISAFASEAVGIRITDSTPLRMTPTTVMSPQGAVGGPASDAYGDDSQYRNINDQWGFLIENQTPTTPDGTNTPMLICTTPTRLNGSLQANPSTTTTISGTWTTGSAATTATIEVFRTRGATTTSLGTVVATSGVQWELTGLAIGTLQNGDIIFATSQSSGYGICGESNRVLVQACTPATRPAPVAFDRATIDCFTDRGAVGTAAPGALVTITNLQSGTTATVTADGSGVWFWTGGGSTGNATNACSTGTSDVPAGTYSITQSDGTCSSVPVFRDVACTPTATPTISQANIAEDTQTISGTATSGSTVVLFIDNIQVASITATAGVYSFALGSYLLQAGQIVSVRAQATGQCLSTVASRTVVQGSSFCNLTTPTITTNDNGNIAVGDPITGFSSEASGTTITVYNNATDAVIGTTTVQADSSWTLGSTAVASTVYYARHTGTSCGTSEKSNTATTLAASTATCGTITSPVNQNAVSVSGTGYAPNGATVRLFIDGSEIGSATVSSGGWTIPVNTTAINTIYAGGVLTTTIQATGQITQQCSSSVTVQCVAPTTPSISTTVPINTSNDNFSVTISNSVSGVLYYLVDDQTSAPLGQTSGTQRGASLFGNGGSLTLTSSSFMSTDGTYKLRVVANPLSGTSCNSQSAQFDVVKTTSTAVDVILPDLGVAQINQPLSGNVSSNDVLAGTITYSTSTSFAGTTLTLNTDGTYDFIATVPGVYEFVVNVCSAPDTPPACPTSTLTITVTNPSISTNPPVANNDVYTVLQNEDVAGNVLNNDINLVTGSSSGLTVTALNGVSGDIAVTKTNYGGSGGDLTLNSDGTFDLVGATTPGTYSFVYTISDGTNLATGTAYITVYATGSSNIVYANDDYSNISKGVTASGNLLTNDTQLTGGAITSATPQSTTVPGVGTFAVLGNGDYTFTPLAIFSGSYQFPYEALGASGASAIGTYHVTVEPFRLNPDVNVAYKGETINGSALTNDVVPAGSTYTNTTGALANATLTLNANGTYTFVATAAGIYTYAIQVCAPTAPTPACETKTLTITVTDPIVETNLPVANSDIAITYADANPANTGVPVTINAIANDEAGNPTNSLVASTADLVGTPAGVVDNGDGTFTYTPAAGFTGTFTFQYTVEDNEGRESAAATVTVTVYPASTPNVVTASDDYATTLPGSPLSINAANGLLANDSQLDGATALEATDGTFTNAGEGTLVLAANGSYSFTPAAGFVGTTSFVYTVTGTDGATATGTAYFTVSSSLVPDVNVGFIDVSIPGDLSTNDLVETGTTYGAIATVIGNPNTNVPILAADGTYTFITDTPGVYNFTYEICSPSMTSPACDTGTLSITVTNPGIITNPPIANNDVATTVADANPANAGTPVTINAAANDEAGNAGGAIDPTSANLVGTPAGVVDNNDGTFTYTPAAGFTGIYTFEYTIDDTDNNGPTTATVTVTVYPASSPNVLIAADDYYTGLSTSAISTGNVLNNDTQLIGGAVTTVSDPGTFTLSGGELTLNADGTFSLIPNPTFQGVTTHTYTAEGTNGATGTATIYFTVYGDLIINPDINVAFKDETVSGTVATNDVVPAGSTYSNTTGALTNATLTLNANGTYTFSASAVGVYTYNIQVCAPTTPPGCETKSLTITVTDPTILTNPPVANTDNYIAVAGVGTNVSGNVLVNDLDLSGTSITVTELNGVALAPVSIGGGTLTLAANGTISLIGATTPGAYSFTYTIEDGNGETATATGYITVYASGTPNVVNAADDYGSTNGITPVSGNVLPNDTQLSGAALSTVTNPGTYPFAGVGSLVLNANGTFTFTPVSGAEGVVNFVYTVQGTDGATASATLYITVYPPLTFTWEGDTSNDWCDPLNWAGGAIPTAGANVVIPSTTTDPTFDFSTCPVCINNLTIASGVTVGLTGKLCVTGDLNSGGEVIGTGSISLEGTTPQTIIGEFNITNLDLNNSAGATITSGAGNMVNITESLELTDGILTTNGNMTLKSDATGSAYLAPVLTCDGSVGLNGDVRVEVYVAGTNRSFRFFGHFFNHSISLQQIRDVIDITGDGLDFNDTGNPSAFWYNTTAGDQRSDVDAEDVGWTPFTSATLANWQEYQGIRVMVRGPKSQTGSLIDTDYVPDPVTFTWVGELNICEQEIRLTYSGFEDGGNAGDSRFNLIANPFPAPLDMGEVVAGDRNSVGSVFYVWEPRRPYASGATGFGPGGGRAGRYKAVPFTSADIQERTLPIGSAFFLESTDNSTEPAVNTNANITFRETYKLPTRTPGYAQPNAGSLFRQEELKSYYGSNSLQLLITEAENDLDRVIVYFKDESNAGRDYWDGDKMANDDMNFFTVSEDNRAQAVDSRPWLEGERFPLHILAPVGNYTMKIPDFDIEAGRKVQLHDRHLDELITLEKGATYEFEVTAEQASKGHRFDIVMGAEVITSIGQKAYRFQAFLLPNPAQQQVMVSIQRPDEVADTHVRLVDVRGVMLYETTLKATDDAQISYEVGGLAKGVYLVEITHGKQRIVKRLMVN